MDAAKKIELIRTLERNTTKQEPSWDYQLWEMERREKDFRTAISNAERALAEIKAKFSENDFVLLMAKQRETRRELISKFHGEYVRAYEEGRRERRRFRDIPAYKRKYQYWLGYLSGLRTIIRLISPLLKTIQKGL